MKKIIKTAILTIILTFLSFIGTVKASIWDDITDTASQFFSNQSTNQFEVIAFGIKNVAEKPVSLANHWGEGLRIQYWPTKVLGTSLDIGYCDSTLTFASLGIGLRGTVTPVSWLSVTPYVSAGPGWAITAPDSVEPTLAAQAGGGAYLTLTKYPKWFLMGEYHKIFTTPEQNQIRFGLGYRF